jgi:WD40 repeat protein
LPYTWSPDARKLLIPGKPLRIWDAQNEALLELPSPGDRIRSIAWAPDAHTFILVGGKTVTVWDAQTGKPVETLTQRSEQRGLIAWSPDGRKLAAAYTDRTIKIWDPRAGAVVNTLMAHTDRIHALAWVSDTDLLTVEQNEPQTIEIWDPQTGIVVRTFAGPVGWISQVAWAPDYSRIAFQAGDDTVKLWDVQTGDVKAFPSSYGQALTWSPDGKRIAVGGRAAEISLWDAGTGKLWNRLATDLKPVRLLWSPDGQRIATIGWQIDGRKSAGSARLDFTIQDAYTGAIIKTLAGQSYSGCYSIGLTAMVWSPDGDRLAWASGYNTIKILDGKSGDVVDTLTGLIGWPKALAWQAGEGDRLAWDAGDGTVRVRVLHEGK